ncbi:MAG TPA: hypothetical protein VJN42_09610 [Candidatus Acidoferrum sp.]|nr:hypothetical protein [Candidatus Acidoferrum sp.]
MRRTAIALLAGSVALLAGLAKDQAKAQSAAEEAESTAALPSGTSLNAELNSSVDSRKAKVGEKVEAHLTEAVTVGGKTVVPRGAKLEGHITEAMARSKGDKDSRLAIRFDQAVPKRGQEIPLDALVMAVAAPQSTQYERAAGPGSDAMGDRGAAAAGGSPMGASRPVGQAGSGLGYPSGGAAGPTNEPASESTGSGRLPPNSRGVYGLKNLRLMETKSEAGPSTFLTSTGKEVRLDGGTRLLLIVQTK